MYIRNISSACSSRKCTGSHRKLIVSRSHVGGDRDGGARVFPQGWATITIVEFQVAGNHTPLARKLARVSSRRVPNVCQHDRAQAGTQFGGER